MADNKPSVNSYNLLGGVNQKASEYSLTKAQFLDLRNLDFDVVNALQKRPGSTQAITAGTSGPITSLFEYVKLTGASNIVAGSDTAMFYMAAGGLTLLSSGWNNGQPTDMLTFVNKLWMANGQKYESWSGQGASALPVGLPCPVFAGGVFGASYTSASSGKSAILVAGITQIFRPTGGGTYIYVQMSAAYRYVRSDGYYGPADFLHAPGVGTSFAPAIVSGEQDGGVGALTNGAEFFTANYDGVTTGYRLSGFTVPADAGITAIALYLAIDVISGNLGNNPTTSLNGMFQPSTPGANYASYWRPNKFEATADQAKFYLYNLYPAGTTQVYLRLNGWTANMLGASVMPFSGMNFCWFNTNTPKYIDVNQNSMFMSGFSNNPSSLTYAEIGEPEVILPESTFEVRTNDGDRLFGHKAFKGQVLAFKENSFSKVIGSNPDEYELVDLSSEIGCISNFTAVEYKDKLLWLDKRGIVEYNGANWDIISTPIDDIFRRMNLAAAKEKACAVHQIYRNQVWFGIPVDGSTTNNLTVVYDYLVGAWTFFDGFNPSSFALVKGPLIKQTAWRGDYSGMIHYFGESFFGDGANAITCLAFTKFQNYGGENETSNYRRFFLDVAKVAGSSTAILGQVFADYDRQTIMHTFISSQATFQTRSEMGVVAKSVAAQLSHSSASLPLLINGFGWAVRPERNV